MKIRTAIAGIGNCASALVQGIHYYNDVDEDSKRIPGLMRNVIGGYAPSDIDVVAAFDVDRRKVGEDVSEAIFADPNCTQQFESNVPHLDVPVQMAPVLDGIAPHMEDYPDTQTFVVAEEEPVDIATVLEEKNVDVLINYLPVGSEAAVQHYANAALETGTAFVNCIPVFIASDPAWAQRFHEKGIPVVGDDIKSQIGATIVHRTMSKLLVDRGIHIERTYQLNTGGNTDFLNMLARDRLDSKKKSKTTAVTSQIPYELGEDNIHIGPSDYVPWQDDNKKAFIRIEGRKFGDVPVTMDIQLNVEDSPNSAGVAIDTIRCAKLGLERNIGGPLSSISAYTMKSPPEQIPDFECRQHVNAFIDNEIKR